MLCGTCGNELPPGAEFCPTCGPKGIVRPGAARRSRSRDNALPQQGKGRRRTFQEDSEEILKVGSWVGLFVTFVGLGIHTVIVNRIASASPILAVIIDTVPLTMAIAILGVGILRGWFDEMHGGQLLLLLLIFIIPFVFSALLGIGDVANWREVKFEGGLPGIIPSLLKYYWRTYGPGMFISSFVVGSFLAWAWGEMILPHLEQE